MRYSFPMNADAHGEGFRIVRSDSTLLPLELLWRWSFGLGLMALLFFAYAHLRQAILISDADEAAFSGQDPLAMATAAAGIVAGSHAAAAEDVCASRRRGVRALDCRRHAGTRNAHPHHRAPPGGRLRSQDRRRCAALGARLRFSTMARVLMLLILVIGYLVRNADRRLRQRFWEKCFYFRVHHLRRGCGLRLGLELGQLGALAGTDFRGARRPLAARLDDCRPCLYPP